MKTNSILLTLFTLASTAFAQLPTNNLSPAAAALLTGTNGNLLAPANFFAANSNLLNASVASTGGGSQSPLAVNVNGAQKSLTNLAGFQAAFATNSTLTVSNQLTGSNATFLSVTSSNGFLGAATSATNLTGSLAAAQITGVISTNNLPGNLAPLAQNNATNLTNLPSTSISIPHSIGAFVPGFLAKDLISLIFTNGLSSGTDNGISLMTENSLGSGASILFPRTGTNVTDPVTGGAPQDVFSINADGSTNYIYDRLAFQIMNVPANAPPGDSPEYALIVANPGQNISLAQNGGDVTGSGNLPFFLTDGSHHKFRWPLWQGYGKSRTPTESGYIDAAVLDDQNGTFLIYSNLFFGGVLYNGTNTSALPLTDAAGLRGDAFDRALNLTLATGSVTATNYVALQNGAPAFSNGAGTGWGMNSSGASGVYYFSGSPMLHIDTSSAIRIEQNAPIQPQTGGWSSLGSAALPFGYSFIKTNLLGWITVTNTAALNDVTLNTLTVSRGACSLITSNLAAAISFVTNHVVDLSKPMTFVSMTAIGQNINFIYCTNWINDTNYQETLFTIVGDGTHSLSFSVPAGENIWTPTNGITTNGVVPASGKIYKLAVSREKIPGLITNTSYALIAPNQ